MATRLFPLTPVMLALVLGAIGGCEPSGSAVQRSSASSRLTGYVHPDYFAGLAFVNGSKTLVTADGQWSLQVEGNRSVQFWDVASGQPLPTRFQAKGPIDGLSVSTDGKRLLVRGSHVTGSSRPGAFLQLWDVPTGHEIPFPELTDPLVALLSPDGQFLAVAQNEPPPEYTLQGNPPHWVPRKAAGQRKDRVQIWEVANQQLRTRLPAVIRGVPGDTIAGFTWDSRLLLTSYRVSPSSEGRPASTRIQLWHAASGTLQAELGISGLDPANKAAAASSDGRWLAAWSGEGCKVHELGTGWSNKLSPYYGGNRRVAFTPDNRIVVSTWGTNGPPRADGASGELTFFDVAQHQVLKRIPLTDQTILALAVSPDGKLVATSGSAVQDTDGTIVKLWHIPR